MARWGDRETKYTSGSGWMGWSAECGCDDFRFNAHHHSQTLGELVSRVNSAYGLRVAMQEEIRKPGAPYIMGYEQLELDGIDPYEIPDTWVALHTEQAMWFEMGGLYRVIVASERKGDRKLYEVSLYATEEEYTPWICKHIATAMLTLLPIAYQLTGALVQQLETWGELIYLPHPLEFEVRGGTSQVMRINQHVVMLLIGQEARVED